MSARWVLGLALVCVACSDSSGPDVTSAAGGRGAAASGGESASGRSGSGGSDSGHAAGGGRGCRCDSQANSDVCAPASAQVSAANSEECAGSDGGTRGDPGSVDCDPRKITCKRAPPNCGQFEVPSVDGSCFGPCVGIEACRCSGPEECPDRDQYTCHMSAKHCTPYL